MRRSKIKPRYTTFTQKQKTHPAPTYRACIYCGCNTNKFYSELTKTLGALRIAAIHRFGVNHMAGYKLIFFCGISCFDNFVNSYKLDILEEITK
jgi:hypothetical protein